MFRDETIWPKNPYARATGFRDSQDPSARWGTTQFQNRGDTGRKDIMFGFFRFGLALLVTIYHLSGLHVTGWYSVYAFYALSGYLMTLVITRKYAFTPAGIGNFAMNRALRIYPPYLVVVITSIVLLSLPNFAPAAKSLIQAPDIGMPESARSWFENLFIVGWRMSEPKLVPQVWTVFRELFYCGLIFVIFGRFRWVALVWFFASVAYALMAVVNGKGFVEIYTSFQSASLAYSAGCCMYHFRDSLRNLTRPIGPLLCVTIAAPFVLEAIRPAFFSHTHLIPFYWNVALGCYLILLLSTLKGSKKIRELDQYFGNLSYPIYLCHFNVGVVMAVILQIPAGHSVLLLLASLPPTLACAWLINRYVEQTIGYGVDHRGQPWFGAKEATAPARDVVGPKPQPAV
jgi:peptidoglycan/LPS O-acetylase OafA/YrhL